MALQYQNTNPFNLPASAQSVIPQELGQDFLSTLNRSIDIQQQKSQEDLLGFQEQRGLLRSGDTNKQLVEQVGAGDQQRMQALLGIAVPAAQQGQQQQFQTQFEKMQFGQQQQMAQQQFEFQLQEMEKQADLQKQLLMLQFQYGQAYRDPGPDSSSQLRGALFTGLGTGLGALIGHGAGGGFGGLLGSMGGKAAGQWATDYSIPMKSSGQGY